MRGSRGQRGRNRIPPALTEAEIAEYSLDVEPVPVMTPSLERVLHAEAWNIYKEEERISGIENFRERHEAEARLEIGKSSLAITMLEHNLAGYEWDDGLCVEYERYSEERKQTIRGPVRVFHK